MKKKIAGIVAIIAVIAALLGVYYTFREKPVDQSSAAGGKNISITVVDADGESTAYTFKTDSDYLENAMNKAEGLEYTTNDGMVMTVNGIRADYTLDGAYWAFYVNGGYCNYGIADQPVNDGDAFVIEYTKANE